MNKKFARTARRYFWETNAKWLYDIPPHDAAALTVDYVIDVWNNEVARAEIEAMS